MKPLRLVLPFSLSLFCSYSIVLLVSVRVSEIFPSSVGQILLSSVYGLIALGILLFYPYRRFFYRRRLHRLLLPLVFILGGVDLLALALAKEAGLFIASIVLISLLMGFMTGICTYLLFSCQRQGHRIGRILIQAGSGGLLLFVGIKWLAGFLPFPEQNVYLTGTLLAIGIIYMSLVYVLQLGRIFEEEGDLFSSLDLPLRERRLLFWSTGTVILFMSLLLGFNAAIYGASSFREAEAPHFLLLLFFIPGYVLAGYLSDIYQGRFLPLLCLSSAVLALPLMSYKNLAEHGLINSCLSSFAGGTFFIYIMVAMMQIGHKSRNPLLAIALPGFLYNFFYGIGVLLMPRMKLLTLPSQLLLSSLVLLALILPMILNGSLTFDILSKKQVTNEEKQMVQQIDSYDFTQREREVLASVLRGLSVKEIAQSLFISQSTVKHYIGRILAKTETKSRVELLAKLSRSR